MLDGAANHARPEARQKKQRFLRRSHAAQHRPTDPRRLLRRTVRAAIASFRAGDLARSQGADRDPRSPHARLGPLRAPRCFGWPPI